MTEKVESLPHDGGFVLSEANGMRSREQVTIAAGAAEIKPGTVMGKRSNGSYYPFDQDATTGEEDAAGILLNGVDPTDGAVKGVVIVRDAEVMGSYLTWPDDISTSEQNAAIAQLLALGIVLRTGPTRVSTQQA